MKDSLHWYPSPCIKNDCNILCFWVTLGRCMVCSVVKPFFYVLRHTEYSFSCAQTFPSNKNASALVVAECEKG